MQEQSISPGTPGVAQTSLPQLNEEAQGLHRYTPEEYETTNRFDTAYRGQRGADLAQQISRALGWFSIGLGVAQLLVPRTMSRAIGVEGNANTIRAIGAREIASGVGILSNQRRPSTWLWTRVAGDAMDLAMLGNAARTRDDTAHRRRIAFATAAVVGVTVLDVLTSMQQSQKQAAEEGRFSSSAVKVEKSITINRSADECYRFWHDFEAFPRFMKHLESVQITGDNRTHWKAKAPAGMSVEWDAELTADEPGKLIAWHSLEGDVDNIGTVYFDPAAGGRGTIVRVELQYSPPGGVAGAMFAKLFGEEPEQQIDEDLRRFKWLIETGEIPTTVGQSAGPRGAMTRLLRKGVPG
jgi:uncharacterized membrane protein